MATMGGAEIAEPALERGHRDGLAVDDALLRTSLD
jgi:hypothetical protein